MLVAMIVITQTALALVVIEVETSLVVLPSPVVSRKLLISVTASALYIIIVHHEVTEPAIVSTLHQSRASAGLKSLQNIPSSKLGPFPAVLPHTGNTSEPRPVPQ